MRSMRIFFSLEDWIEGLWTERESLDRFASLWILARRRASTPFKHAPPLHLYRLEGDDVKMDGRTPRGIERLAI